LVSCFTQNGLFIIDRSNKRNIKIEHPHSSLLNCSDIMPVPGYDYTTFPYVLVRCHSSIELLNVRDHRLYTLNSELKPNFDNEFTTIA